MSAGQRFHVAVVVVTWNGWADTAACLDSLRRISHRPLSIIVSDNGSVDETLPRLASDFPEVHVVENGENLGFAGGNNRGIARALTMAADGILVLNNDTIVEPGFIEPLVAALTEDANLGVVSPVITYPDDRGIWFAGSEIDETTSLVHHRQFALWPPQRGLPERISTPSVTGCCLLARREVFEQVGGFDERFFLIFEDADWSMRIRRAGFRAAVIPESRIQHHVSASFARGRPGLGAFYFVRNGLLFLALHGSPGTRPAVRFLSQWLLRPFLRGIRKRRRGTLRELVIGMAGVTAFLLKRWGRMPEAVRRGLRL